MTPTKTRLHRSELAVPGSNVRMLEKAPSLGADVVMLDLEDAVAPDDKEQARINLVDALREQDWSRCSVSVRINGLDTHWCYRDIVDVVEQAGEHVDAIVIPKVSGAGDVWHYPLARIAVPCRAYGLRPIDGPYGDFTDPEGYIAAARRSAVLGYEGKWAIHPSQVPLANEVYTPAPRLVERTRRIIEAMREAAADGKGAVSLDGRLIDAASIRMAENLLAKLEQIEARSAGGRGLDRDASSSRSSSAGKPRQVAQPGAAAAVLVP